MRVSFWLYTSKSMLVRAEAYKAIAKLVSQSRKSNIISDISGALLCTRHMFAQYIEGPDIAVERLYDKILKDVRHIDVKTVDQGKSDDRIFENWALAYFGQATYVDILALVSVVRGRLRWTVLPVPAATVKFIRTTVSA